MLGIFNIWVKILDEIQYQHHTLLGLAFGEFQSLYFLAATKQLYEWLSPSGRLSVCRLSVCDTFFTMFLSS